MDNSGRRWARSGSTRQALLAGALEVFSTRGYEDASIAEIVERSGASVGSLYHHYGGKAGLFLALWDDHHRTLEETVAAAVAGARHRGVGDPFELFIEGARAFLRGCWDRRAVARLFLEDAGPQGFNLLRRQRVREWVRRNTRLLRADEAHRSGQMLVVVLTTVIAEAGREVAASETAEEARELIDEACVILSR
ncbi:MAG TPA: TetR/AcrR family transcriptional regulator, partial [Actinomycetes bacterium]|nr:TetR/AcrR family transcriptional regulator [Actinomycetes bacterium]